MKYLIQGFISKVSHDITSEVVMPLNEELSKSLFSDGSSPYLVSITVRNIEYKVKITSVKRSIKNRQPYESSLSIYGYIQKIIGVVDENSPGEIRMQTCLQDRTDPTYAENANWIKVLEYPYEQ